MKPTHTSSIDIALGEGQPPIAVTLDPVKSSQIAALGYHPASQTLVVQFVANEQRGETAGSVYSYANVSPEMHDEFRAAESIGRFFKERIRPATLAHPFAKVRPAMTEPGNDAGERLQQVETKPQEEQQAEQSAA